VNNANIGYKYDPDDFNDMLGIPNELSLFYKLYETYKKERTQKSWLTLRKHWEDLFFSIKHREVEGFLNPVEAQEIRDYLEDLVNERCDDIEYDYSEADEEEEDLEQ
jgi:hypothetical protein